MISPFCGVTDECFPCSLDEQAHLQEERTAFLKSYEALQRQLRAANKKVRLHFLVQS